jgi:hypothetical protein
MSTMSFRQLSATTSCVPWDQLSRIGDWLVVVFGMILWISYLVSLACLGMHAVLTRRDKGKKHKGSRHAKQTSRGGKN